MIFPGEPLGIPDFVVIYFYFMRRIFTGLLAGVVACFISCDKTEEGNKWFSTPQYVVNGTTVAMSCQTQFGPGVLSASNAGFSYAPVVGEGVVEFKKASGVTVDGSTLHATLSGLAPKTVYVAYAYADLGAGQMQSVGISFQTGEGGSLPEPDPENPAFGTPWVSDVTASSAMLNCGFTFEEATSSYTLCFEYRPISDGSYTQKSVSSGTGSKSVLLTGLSASTEYEFRLCAEWQGETYASDSGHFTTSASESGGDGGDVPSPGLTRYSGWAELPVEVNKPGDYYYAYHMRADAGKIRNFSVCYSKEYECPVWVAAPMHISYKGNSGRNDAYKQDPVLAGLGCSQIEKRTGYTRGHLLGSSDRTVSVSTNKQVFYLSNIAPQLQSGFNQGQGVWNNLEAYVDGLWCTEEADTLYQVVGCYWENTDTKASGTVIPTHYYKALLQVKHGNEGKWVVNCSRDELQCVAFLVRHNSSQKYTTPNRSMLISIDELEKMTGFTFFANVPNAPKDTYDPKDWGL